MFSNVIRLSRQQLHEKVDALVGVDPAFSHALAVALVPAPEPSTDFSKVWVEEDDTIVIARRSLPEDFSPEEP